MKLPRLRARELLVLIVYLALFGQAFILGITESKIRVSPSGLSGYAWLPASDLGASGLSCKLAHPWEDEKGRVWIAGTRDPVPAWILHFWRWPSDAVRNEAYHLVPDRSPEGVAIREADRAAMANSGASVKMGSVMPYTEEWATVDQNGNVFVLHAE